VKARFNLSVWWGCVIQVWGFILQGWIHAVTLPWGVPRHKKKKFVSVFFPYWILVT
jgi:hypothetical protein